MIYGTLINASSPLEMLGMIGAVASPIFDDLKPFLFLVVGVVLALLVVGFAVKLLSKH